MTAAFHWVGNLWRTTNMLKSLANIVDNSSGMNFSMLADIVSIPADPADGRSESSLRTSLDEISLSLKILIVAALISVVLAEDILIAFVRGCCCLSNVILSLKLRFIMLTYALLSTAMLRGQNKHIFVFVNDN